MRSERFAAAVLLGLSVAGCQQASTVPELDYSGLSVRGVFQRRDFEVNEAVQGESTTLSFLFGALQIVDGNKVQVLWIPLFKDQYTPVSRPQGPGAVLRWLPFGLGDLILKLMGRTEERAYFQALQAAPEADVVLEKSSDLEFRGVPGVCSFEKVVFRGRALRLRPDPTGSAGPPAAAQDARSTGQALKRRTR